MKTQLVELLDVIEHDIDYAQRFYDSWLTDGAQVFYDRFRETISWIEWNPELFPRRYRHFRRAIIPKTYFGIYFAIEPAVTTVMAVLDLRQDPRVIRQLLRLRLPPG